MVGLLSKSAMKVLLLDTTTPSGMLALADSGEIVFSEVFEGKAKHGETLATNIARILKNNSWQSNDIKGIGVALGPGSFMGLRIGLATAKGLASGLNIPIAGYSSLQALANSENEFSGMVVPLIDARRSEVYVSAYDFSEKKSEILKKQVLSPENLKVWLDKQKKKLLLIGDGAELYREKFEGENVTFKNVQVPKPEVCLELVQDKLNAGGDDINSLVPDYVRLSDAEIGFKGASKRKKG